MKACIAPKLACLLLILMQTSIQLEKYRVQQSENEKYLRIWDEQNALKSLHTIWYFVEITKACLK